MPAQLLFRRLSSLTLLPILILVLLAGGPAAAQWGINPTMNTPIAVATDSQEDPVVVTDSAGGAIIAWVDFRTGQGKDIYAQRVDPSGVIQWTSNGIVVCGESGIQDALEMISDGAGGAILVWEDQRSGTDYDIYAQRLSPAGAAMWTAGGLKISSAPGDQESPAIVADGVGGAVISWNDLRPTGTSSIYAQRVTAAGQLLWAANGVPVRGAVILSQFVPPGMLTDGKEGAFLSWDDARSMSTGPDIYMQRVDSAGVSLWDTNAVAVCAAGADQHGAVLATDRSGGAIAAWTDYRSAPNTGIYAQRVDAAGKVQWATDGVVVNDTTDNQQDPVIVSDSAATVVIAWADRRGGTNFDVYAQRVGPSGNLLWAPGGVPLCTAPGDQLGLRIRRDGANGAIVVWTDSRTTNDNNIYAQRVDGSGNVRWQTDGVPVSTAPSQQELHGIALTPHFGLIVAWTDGRGTSDDVYAQSIDSTGALGLAPVPLLPLGGAAVGVDSVRIVWSTLVPPSARYWLDVATDSLFAFRSIDSTLTDTAKTITGLTHGQTYWWRVKGFDGGWGPFSPVRSFGRLTTGVQVAQGLPSHFSLSQNYPNPFNPTTTIRYALPHAAMVTLAVFDELGRQVALLAQGRKEAGTYEAVFQASGLASGIYYCRLQAEGFVQIRGLVLLR